MLDLTKSELVPRDFSMLRFGEPLEAASGTWTYERGLCRAQLAKALLGPDGVVAWLNELAEDEPDIQVCVVVMRLIRAARAAGLGWPMKEVQNAKNL